MLAGLAAGTSLAVPTEKIPDLANVTPQAGLKSILQGALSGNSPTYDRPYGTEVSLDCDAPMIDSANDDVYLEIFCLQSVDAYPIQLVVDAAGTNITDTVLTIYCSNFDPSDPLGNAIVFDDDGGEGTLSAITFDDGVILTPGRIYWAVLSTYGATMTGNYLLQASENLATCDAVPVASSTWGALKATYR
jgi:hypothetical protein